VGFYLRKSVRAGPFRFNLSKSGLGMSAGVKGLRVGTGPRGSYVHMGAGGVYYRQTLSPARKSAAGGSRSRRDLEWRGGGAPEQGRPLLERVTLVDSVGHPTTALADELNAARRRMAINPLSWLSGKRRVPALYRLDDEVAVAYQGAIDAFSRVATAQGAWLVDAAGAVAPGYQRKVNAGASNVIDRRPARRTIGGPKHLSTNVAIPSLTGADINLYLLPDRVIVEVEKRYVVLAYDQLRLEASPTRFIENESVPSDARQVGQTWQFVNRDGGPDRRFKNNRQLPILEYDELAISGPGLRLVWNLSDVGSASALVEAFLRLSKEVSMLPVRELSGGVDDADSAEVRIGAGPPTAAQNSPTRHAGGLPPPSPSPTWFADPSGQHTWRWWDGNGWTDHVA
jgi:hypothetical protein